MKREVLVSIPIRRYVQALVRGSGSDGLGLHFQPCCSSVPDPEDPPPPPRHHARHQVEWRIETWMHPPAAALSLSRRLGHWRDLAYVSAMNRLGLRPYCR